jgi:predicted glycosyltransferase
MESLQKKGHNIKVMIKERENMVSPLLKRYGFEYENLTPNAPTMAGKAKNMVMNDLKILGISRRFRPDLFVSVASPFSAQASWFLKKPHICLTDTEDAKLQLRLMKPFTESILTPDCFLSNFPEKKHIRYKGYHELGYLHHKRFDPDSKVLDELGIKKKEKFVIMRFSAWDASHDIGQHGFKTLKERINLVQALEEHAEVFISSEIPLEGELDKNRITIPAHRIHDAMYFASLYIGDGHKMATESGILGTPSILVSTRWNKMGYS